MQHSSGVIMSAVFVFGFITLLCYGLHITWPIKKGKN